MAPKTVQWVVAFKSTISKYGIITSEVCKGLKSISNKGRLYKLCHKVPIFL